MSHFLQFVGRCVYLCLYPYPFLFSPFPVFPSHAKEHFHSVIKWQRFSEELQSHMSSNHRDENTNAVVTLHTALFKFSLSFTFFSLISTKMAEFPPGWTPDAFFRRSAKTRPNQSNKSATRDPIIQWFGTGSRFSRYNTSRWVHKIFSSYYTRLDSTQCVRPCAHPVDQSVKKQGQRLTVACGR